MFILSSRSHTWRGGGGGGGDRSGVVVVIEQVYRTCKVNTHAQSGIHTRFCKKNAPKVSVCVIYQMVIAIIAVGAR